MPKTIVRSYRRRTPKGKVTIVRKHSRTIKREKTKETDAIIKFLRSKFSLLVHKGYNVEVVRLSDWITFHIKKRSDLAFGSILDIWDIVVRPAFYKKGILVYLRDIYNNKKSYSYESFEKFKKGLNRILKNRYNIDSRR